MKIAGQNGFRAFRHARPIFSLLLIFLVLSSTAAGEIRKVEISRFVQPARANPAAAHAYFPRHGRFGGGVVPRGTVEFFGQGDTRVDASQLRLVILDSAKLRNNRPDFDTIGIKWNGNVYQLSTQDDLIYPLLKFIQRGRYIAFTLPSASDETYFKENGLVGFGGAYVAEEFTSAPNAEFLAKVDLLTQTEVMPPTLKAAIIQDVTKDVRKAVVEGTYVNADFHVNYQVFLENVNGRRVADVGGLPLRYFWNIAENGGAVVHDVEVFRFPTPSEIRNRSLQYRAILFFQTVAILRQFSRSNKAEFNRFLSEVGAVLGQQ